MTDHSANPQNSFLKERPPQERASAVKERIYATFTGLAIIAVLSAETHVEPVKALITLALGIVGIAAAGLVAEVIAHQVTHAAAPTGSEVKTMARISSGALASASAPLLVLGASCLGWIELDLAVQIGAAIYVAILALVAVLAVARTAMSRLQKVWALMVMLGFIALVVLLLLLSKLH